MGYLWLEITLAQLRGIEPYEILQVLGGRRRRPVLGHSAEGVRILTIWGRTRAGRPLVVALRRIPETPRDWWIVGAREMSEPEHVSFAQWESTAGDEHE